MTKFLLFFLLVPALVLAQSVTISGTIKDSSGEPLIGATIILKGAAVGTVADFEGRYELRNVPVGQITLIASFTGFAKQERTIEVSEEGYKLDFVLVEDALRMDEVVITGAFDERTRMESSVSITTLSAELIQRQAPVSSADLLKNVPGVFVNAASGEVRNAVYSRGVSANSTDPVAGYSYVSLQEDGLPVTNVTYGNYGPDYFLRNDVSVRRLAAVRGGSAAVTSFNAPGGIFNYISKTGGEEFEGLVQLKTGILGDGNTYIRTDLNLGGPTGVQGLYYNIGGFYRNDEGARSPDYPMNRGGQIRGNLAYIGEKTKLTLFVKYLNDFNGVNSNLPAVNFDDPQIAPGFSLTDNFFLPDINAEIPFRTGGETFDFTPRDMIESEDFSIGLNFEQDLGKDWELSNNFKFSAKNHNWNFGGGESPQEIDQLGTHILLGTVGRFGSIDFRDPDSGEVLANVLHTPQFDGQGNLVGFNFDTTFSNLPGSDLFPNGAGLSNIGLLIRSEISEIMNDFKIRKEWENMGLTIGGFYGRSDVNNTEVSAGNALGFLEDTPRLLDITVTQQDGNVLQVTNPQGLSNLGSPILNQVRDATYSQLAGFIGHNWNLTENLILDWGLRVENISFEGSNDIARGNPAAMQPGFGGIDNNPNTLFDNNVAVESGIFSFDESLTTFSLSGALNYKFSDNFAVYGRYSRAERAPQLSLFHGIDTPLEESNPPVNSEIISQLEAGFKVRGEKFSAVVTPFYSFHSDIFSSVLFQNPDGSIYQPPALFNSIETIGVEIEGNFTLARNLSLRSVATFQRAETDEWQTWIANGPGPDDDVLRDFSGNRADNNPDIIINVSPNYNTDKFFAGLTWNYLGNRAANIPNTFELPGFNQFDFAASYDITKNITVQANVNNIFDTLGVMGWIGPGGFPVGIDRQGFTPEKLQQNPDAIFSIVPIQPRSYFLTFSYSF